jgi:hypothetical protein
VESEDVRHLHASRAVRRAFRFGTETQR